MAQNLYPKPVPVIPPQAPKTKKKILKIMISRSFVPGAGIEPARL